MAISAWNLELALGIGIGIDSAYHPACTSSLPGHIRDVDSAHSAVRKSGHNVVAGVLEQTSASTGSTQAPDASM
jgi:hypothetical protein